MLLLLDWISATGTGLLFFCFFDFFLCRLTYKFGVLPEMREWTKIASVFAIPAVCRVVCPSVEPGNAFLAVAVCAFSGTLGGFVTL